MFLLLVICTLSCLLFPIKYQGKIDTEKQEIVEEYKKHITKAAPASLDYQKKYNDDLLEQGSITTATIPDFYRMPEVDGVIGTLSFPTVCLTETPIYKEKAEKTFFHYKYGSFPTIKESGHTVLSVSDHWKNIEDLVRLAQLKVGDYFYLRVGDQSCVYQIMTILTSSSPEERNILPNEQLLTIERKNLSGFTDNQVIIKGRKIVKSNLQKNAINPKIIFNYQTIVIIFLLFNSLFFGGLVVSYQRYVRKTYAKPFRTKNFGYKHLRRLLQITRGYYILMGLVMSFYLAMIVYRFFY